MPVFVAMVPVIIVILLMTLFSCRHLRGCWIGRGGALEKFIQLAAVEPNTSAGWALVDFHTLLVGHHQGLIFALWAFHLRSSESG